MAVKPQAGFLRCARMRARPIDAAADRPLPGAPQRARDALLEFEALPGRAGGHVGVGEGVQQRPVLGRELGQGVDQAALLGLEPAAGVVGDQGGQAILALLARRSLARSGVWPNGPGAGSAYSGCRAR
jgi:hypothetical protein